ncbi:hypothetical protein N7478_010757 [Penicillium angulare]|uniref:uncharacterized protein n=1 Tax=Penicillium angulare TaxID=116970 RepID=UPI002540C097|nr:uncharacterized protein N7478_010757 [Penicillium angulare]KAJ5263152.1 hypothetical protein N7478_010757 [Penicillium angulare]
MAMALGIATSSGSTTTKQAGLDPSSLRDAEGQMADVCLRYLLMEDLEDDNSQSSNHTQHLLEYAAVYWADHAKQIALTVDYEVANRLH